MQKKKKKHTIKNTHTHTKYDRVCVSGCVSVGVCVGVWFRVSAWRVGAWVRGCVGVFFIVSHVFVFFF